MYVANNATGSTNPAAAQPAPAKQPAPSASASVSHRPAAQRGGRLHTVEQGESLWSIARDLLGDDASAARIAREVNRLWELNSARIGTGDRDLLMVGTRIAVR